MAYVQSGEGQGWEYEQDAQGLIFRYSPAQEAEGTGWEGLAREAAAAGEVPVGCVIVLNGEVVGRGRNLREETGRADGHAEMEAIAQANETLGSWRLEDCSLYVTLEPCPMCAGAIINARVEAVRYGAREEKSGCCGSVLNLFEERFNHRPRIYRGPLERECEGVLQAFFQSLR